MNNEEKNKKISEVETKVANMLKNFKAKDGKIASEDKFTWRDIAKVQTSGYVGQDEVSLDIYFYSTGKSGNNKPYTYHKKVSDEIASKFRSRLNEARKIDSTMDDEDIDPIKDW